MNSLVIGSRGSQLALIQTHLVADQIRKQHPDLNVSVEVIRTTGDKTTTTSLAKLAGETKGLFVKEIEEALLEKRVDLAVHSLKDVPSVLPEGLSLGAIPKRGDARDALVSEKPLSSFDDLRHAARLGTSSLRRAVQLKLLRPDLSIVPVRGNVDTRIRKLRRKRLDGVVLAAAGLKRMGFADQISYVFPVEEMVPAIGQGCLAIEVRGNDRRVLKVIECLDDATSRRCVMAEREFLKQMGGGCQVPMGAHAALQKERSHLFAFVASPSGGKMIRRNFSGKVGELDHLVARAVQFFRAQGAEEILAEVTSE